MDLSYFYLLYDGFHSILPILEKDHLGRIKRLNIAGNDLTDLAITELCEVLRMNHN